MILSALALMACNATQEKPSKAVNVFDELEQKVIIAQGAKETSTNWANAKGVSLSLVGPIYQTGLEKRSAANKALTKVISYIQDNPKKLDLLAKRSISGQFSTITAKEFVLGNDEFSYVPAIFNVGYGDETALNSVFDLVQRRGNNAEIGFYIDAQAWQQGRIHLQGYKTIKRKGKDRNSTWFTYRLELKDQDNKAKIDALLRMSLYALGSDIREFASINRDAVMQFNDKDYVVERGNGDTHAFVYQDRVKLIDNEIEARINALDKERILNKTAYARSIHLDQSQSYLMVNTLQDYESKVSLLSLKNTNQNTLVWESKQWDEFAKQAFYLPNINSQLMLTDKRLMLKKQGKVLLERQADAIHSVQLVESKNQAYFIDGTIAYALDMNSAKLKPLTAFGQIDKLSLNPKSTNMYVISTSGMLSFFDIKNQRLSPIKSGMSVSGMQACGDSDNLLYWQGSQAYVFDKKAQQSLAVKASSPFSGDIVTGTCALNENKFMLMTQTGEIRQFDGTDFTEITLMSGTYDAYDTLNSGFIIQYLSNNEFIYGGKGNLKIRPSTTESEIRLDYQKRLGKINSARSWLDKSSIHQAVFAEPIPKSDMNLYQALFSHKLETSVQTQAYLTFLNEEQADPLLVANKPSLFNALSGGVSVFEDGNIMLVKQGSLEPDNLYTTSIPNWEHLGFKVESLYLGSQGFEPKVYKELDNAQLTSDIVSMTIASNGEYLVTSLTNGEIIFESLSDTGRFKETFSVHDTQVTTTALSSNNQLLATAGKDGLIKIWRLNLNPMNEGSWIRLETELKGYAGNVLDLAFMSDDLLISTGTDQTVKLWDIKNSNRVQAEMLGHTDSIQFARYDDSLNIIISSSDDASIRIWNPDTAEQIKSFKTSSNSVSDYDVAANLLAYTQNQLIWVKNLASGNTLGKVALTDEPLAVELGVNGQVVYAIYPDRISVFHVSSNEHINDINLTNQNQIKQVFSSFDAHDLYLMTNQEASVINMGKYALFGLDNVY